MPVLQKFRNKKQRKVFRINRNRNKNAEGLSTGLDHIKELGVTHVHLLPCFDFYSIDESQPINHNITGVMIR
jgi:pullulanase